MLYCMFIYIFGARLAPRNTVFDVICYTECIYGARLVPRNTVLCKRATGVQFMSHRDFFSLDT
jgi:hypothetical protein